VKASPHSLSHGIQVSLTHPGPATCFATIRLAGSLPAHTLHELLEHEHAGREFLAGLAEPSTKDAVCAEEELMCLEELDRHLTKHRTGPEWLGEPSVAKMISEALRQKDGAEYDLLLYCIMPNHVHCVIDTSRLHGEEQYAPKAISALKRHTAHEANSILQRTGPFWEHDHLECQVRTSDTFCRILWDVLSDPVRADLCAAWHEWPWSYCRPGLIVAGAV
jgi:putative transposase